MPMRRRNPYLILGVPFGASREEAHRAYEHRRAPMRESVEEHRAELADLEWAIQQIDNGPVDPWLDMTTYRLPADAEAMRVEGAGVFVPAPEVLPPDPATTVLGRIRRAAAAHEYLRYLLAEHAPHAELPPP
jgi:hypothetical protein